MQQDNDLTQKILKKHRLTHQTLSFLHYFCLGLLSLGTIKYTASNIFEKPKDQTTLQSNENTHPILKSFIMGFILSGSFAVLSSSLKMLNIRAKHHKNDAYQILPLRIYSYFTNKPTVSQSIIDSLTYKPTRPENISDYSNLTKQDITNLTTYLDFSKLDDQTKTALLQYIINESNENPILCRLYRKIPTYAQIITDPSQEYSAFLGENNTPPEITLTSFISMAHEFTHAVQDRNELKFKNIDMWFSFMFFKEMHANSYRVLQELHPEKMVQYFLIVDANKTKDLSQTEKIGKAQEKVVGVLFKCLCQNSQNAIDKILNQHFPKTVSEPYRENIYFFVHAIHKAYESSIRYNNIAFEIKHFQKTEKGSFSDQFVTALNDFYSKETGIDQNILDINMQGYDPRGIPFQNNDVFEINNKMQPYFFKRHNKTKRL